MTFDEVAKKCYEMLNDRKYLGEGLTTTRQGEVVDYINSLKKTDGSRLSNADKKNIIEKIRQLDLLSKKSPDGRILVQDSLEGIYVMIAAVENAVISNNNGDKK